MTVKSHDFCKTGLSKGQGKGQLGYSANYITFDNETYTEDGVDLTDVLTALGLDSQHTFAHIGDHIFELEIYGDDSYFAFARPDYDLTDEKFSARIYYVPAGEEQLSEVPQGEIVSGRIVVIIADHMTESIYNRFSAIAGA